MTSTDMFELVTNGGASDFAAVVTILNQHGLWCLVGGLAVNCYVEPVYTMDADMVVVSASLPKIQNELGAAGFQVTEHEHSINAQMKGSELRIHRSALSGFSSGYGNKKRSRPRGSGSLARKRR